MAASSLSLTCVSTTLPKRVRVLSSPFCCCSGSNPNSGRHGFLSRNNFSLNNHPQPSDVFPATATFPGASPVTCSKMEENLATQHDCKRRSLLLGMGAVSMSLLQANTILAEEVPKNYQAFVDLEDGYSYYYPSDWREFDFRAHDSAFKDRYLQLQNVRVRFLPTEKKDIHEIGPIEEVVHRLVNHVYPAPTQKPTIYSMEERTVDGKNYYTFEYILESPNYASASFATIAVGNGRYYTLIVGANERRWKRFRNMLKVVADSFKVIDI